MTVVIGIAIFLAIGAGVLALIDWKKTKKERLRKEKEQRARDNYYRTREALNDDLYRSEREIISYLSRQKLKEDFATRAGMDVNPSCYSEPIDVEAEEVDYY